jgi:predicted Rossmann-fold nucleotide-binding protein
LVGEAYWEGMLDWIKETMLGKENNISHDDMDLINIVNTPNEAVEIIEEFYKEFTLKPNF